MALYYLFTEGGRIKENIKQWSPLLESDTLMLVEKTGRAITSVVKGSIGTASIQGIVATIGFFIFGLPNAFLWGSITAIAALVPSVGTSLVVIPAVLYLLVTGSIYSAIGLGIWGIVAVGSIDNLVSPMLSGKGTGLNLLITILSVFGGLSFFGISGIFLGPVLVSVFCAIFDIYINSIRRADTE